MDFDYFYGRGADQFAFYQIPKILVTDEKFAGITMESKILYSLMLDRASLSAKNGWLLLLMIFLIIMRIIVRTFLLEKL